MRAAANLQHTGLNSNAAVPAVRPTVAMKPRPATAPSNPSSPDVARRTATVGGNEKSPTPARKRNGGVVSGGGPIQVQRPSRLPVVSIYGNKPSSPILDRHLRPTIGRKSSIDQCSIPSLSNLSGTPGRTETARKAGSPASRRVTSPVQRATATAGTSPKRGDVSRRAMSPTLPSLPTWRRSPSLSRSVNTALLY